MDPMAISDFTAHEQRALTVMALAIDGIDPTHRETARQILKAARELDDVSGAALSDALDAMEDQERWRDLVDYFCSDRPLAEVQSEIFHADNCD